MKKNHEFHPTLNGRLEDRLVLNGSSVASAAHVAPQAILHAQQTTPTGAVNFTTLRYYNIVINIHSAIVDFGHSGGSVSDTNRLLNKVYNQVKYIPYAVSDGLGFHSGRRHPGNDPCRGPINVRPSSLGYPQRHSL